jgi:uncharacterized protein (TIGR00251 family)
VRDGVRVQVRLTPRAARDRIDGLMLEADGSASLKVAVTAVPESGKANAALVALLAKAWKQPKSAVTIASGAGSRRKTLFVAGDPAKLLASLDAWLARQAARR